MEGVGLTVADKKPERFRSRRSSRRRSNLTMWNRGSSSCAQVDNDEADAWAGEQQEYVKVLRQKPRFLSALAERLDLPVEALGALEFGLRERNPLPNPASPGYWIDLGPA